MGELVPISIFLPLIKLSKEHRQSNYYCQNFTLTRPWHSFNSEQNPSKSARLTVLVQDSLSWVLFPGANRFIQPHSAITEQSSAPLLQTHRQSGWLLKGSVFLCWSLRRIRLRLQDKDCSLTAFPSLGMTEWKWNYLCTHQHSSCLHLLQTQSAAFKRIYFLAHLEVLRQ